ncbi:potassium channel family protein [Tateyamaria sp.]|uniref:potassium channel family protein n=1 Tax=Tateyamaria sp. TaxID=1929288 RepID=UPI00329D5D8C
MITFAMAHTFKETLIELYTGASQRSRVFRYALLAFDFFSIFLFVAITPLQQTVGLELLTLPVGLVILADFSARLWISTDRKALLRRVYVIADMIVIATLIISPFVESDTAFLRILRGLRLVHSYYLLNDLRHISPFFQKHEQAVFALVNFFVFVFFSTALVFTFFADASSGFAGYVDALYFTISTLTTTGYGDITPTTVPGKLMAVTMMVVGVSLFVQFARAIFMPSKAFFECKKCGLTDHDIDASHCKHCGEIVKIRTHGFS